jgi:hypothetical protein
MVPLSDKRHRLYDSEIPEVIRGLRLRLIQLLEEKNEPEKAQIILNCLHRLLEDKPGRPKYPEFSWDYLTYVVDVDEEDLLRRSPE